MAKRLMGLAMGRRMSTIATTVSRSCSPGGGASPHGGDAHARWPPRDRRTVGSELSGRASRRGCGGRVAVAPAVVAAVAVAAAAEVAMAPAPGTLHRNGAGAGEQCHWATGPPEGLGGLRRLRSDRSAPAPALPSGGLTVPAAAQWPSGPLRR